MFTLRPSTKHEANAVVAAWHRHSDPVRGLRFALAAEKDGRVVGVAVVGRTTAQALHGPLTAEVTRLCTDGTFNACSMLYGACWRVWREMGGRTLYTYTRQTEPGYSLLAAGWQLDAEIPASPGWDRKGRPRSKSAGPRPALYRWVKRR